jgi:hypothetical protein
MSERSAVVSFLVVPTGFVLAAPAFALDIADASPPPGTVGVPHSYTFSLSPGSGSVGATWRSTRASCRRASGSPRTTARPRADPLRVRLVGPKPRWLAFDASTGTLSGTTKLKPTKPLVVLTRTKHGVRRILRKRPPHALSYNLYVTATDALGQRKHAESSS